MPAARSYQFQEVTVIPLSNKERASQTISNENLGAAVAAVQRDGIVVLSNAVDPREMDTLNEVLCEEAHIMKHLPTTHFNENSKDGRPVGNMSQGPPLSPDLMYPSIWANGPASSLISSILGPSPHVNYVNGNTALPGYTGARQSVHADLTFNHATFPFAYVANYYLTDVSPANGSTELWIGSHQDTTFADHRNCGVPTPPGASIDEVAFGIRPELLEQRRVWAPPIQPTIPKGSVVIRDLRLWHAGIANPGTDPRIMLAFVHTPNWYMCPGRVVLPEAAKELVESWGKRKDAPVVYDAVWVPAEVDHKTVKFTPNFSSANEGYKRFLPDLPEGYTF